MIVEIGGSTGGLKEYLEHGRKAGRELHRDQLDQRIALIGDLEVFEKSTQIHQGDGQKYDHITLSFSESHVTDEMLKKAADEFLEHALLAWPEQDRARVAFYAEAHRPKIQSYTNSKTGEQVERFTHIHIGLGRHDLKTGAAIEPLGFLGHQTNLKYIDAWQESFNSKHGFRSPKDNPKITPENAIDVLARYTGDAPGTLETFNNKKAALEISLKKKIIAENITTWVDFGKMLESYGEVSMIREGQFNEAYRIKPSGEARAMRLKGVLFKRQFIERPTAEKIAILSEKATAAYLEQMQPRKEPAYVAETLNYWKNIKARENRYLHTGSRFYQEVYLPADAGQRVQIINNLERENHGIQSSANHKNRKITPARNRVPGMPIRNLDGIQSRTEMLLRGHTSMDVGARFATDQVGFELRQADGGGPAELSSGGVESLIQPSSVLARVQADLKDRYMQAADKERYGEIRRNLNCTQLLASLTHAHGLNLNLYQVATAKDGTPRIQCGSRALSASDFLSKELGLPWKEAAPILRAAYEAQLGIKETRARGVIPKNQLWVEFKTVQLVNKPTIAKQLKVFDEQTMGMRGSLIASLKKDHAKALVGITGATRKATQSLQKRAVAVAKAELNDERRALRKTIQPIQKQAWLSFLQGRAGQGDQKALEQLRKLDDTARAAPANSITGVIDLDGEDQKKKRKAKKSGSEAAFLAALTHSISTSGDVTYSTAGVAVLRDEGQHLAVLDPSSDEAIKAALLLGREKFGNTLTLTGSIEFQEKAVRVAVANGIHVKFSDPNLEALRLQLKEKNRQVPAEKLVHQAIPEIQQTREAEEPAPAPVAQQQPMPVQTAVQWCAEQGREVVQAYAKGDASTAYMVVYVAQDDVVLDHGGGRAGVYKVPEGGDSLSPGQRVLIDKNGGLKEAIKSHQAERPGHGR